MSKNICLSLSLQPTEKIVWSDIKKAGIIHRRVVQVLAVTNQNIIIWKENLGQSTVPISTLSDIVVMDRRSTGSSKHYTYSLGSRYLRNYISTGKYSSSQIGTIIFFVDHQKPRPRFTWYGVSDPVGLKNLVNSLKENIWQEQKKRS